MVTEREAKFLADGPEPLEALRLASELDGARLGAPAAFDETDRYLDTADGRVAASRWACRLRSRGVSVRVSLKGPAEPESGSWLHHRPEVEGPAIASLDPAAWPESEARSMLDLLTGGAPLIEGFRLEQRRTERRVELDGEAVGTLTLDRAQVYRSGRRAGELFVVELELDPAADAVGLDLLGIALARWPGLRPDPHTKLEHALRLLSEDPRVADAG